MSEIFHKSCYTSRSPGYKYRTLSTNTGEKKSRDSREDNLFERKFRELRQDIRSRIDFQVEKTHQARESILDKLNKIDAKIDSMLTLQNTVTSLRNDLRKAEITLSDMLFKVEKMDSRMTVVNTASTSLQTPGKSFRSAQSIIFEEKETHDSTTTHV